MVHSLKCILFRDMGKVVSSSCASVRSARNGYGLGGLCFVFVKGFCYVLLLLPVSIIYGDNVTSEQHLKAEESVAVSCALKISLEPKYFSAWAFFCCKSVFTHFFQERKFEIKSCDAVLTRAEHSYGLL